MTPFHHRASARSRTAILWLTLWGALWCGLYSAVPIHPVVIGVVVCVTLPLVWDVITNRIGTFTLTENAMTWSFANKVTSHPRQDIDHVVFNTRLDGSRKMTVILTTGHKAIVPPLGTPPFHALSKALDDHRIKYVTRHFSLL
jgi:hypothetical protein